MIGTPRERFHGKYYFGEQLFEDREVFEIRWPMDRGVIDVKDMYLMEEIWTNCYNTLKVSPADQGVLVTVAPWIDERSLERMVQIFFEKLEVPLFYTDVAATLALYSTGAVTGCVLDSGYGVTQATPIKEGYLLRYGMKMTKFGGQDVTAYMS